MDVLPGIVQSWRAIPVTQPAAGAEFTYTISGLGEHFGMLIKSVAATLVQGATQTPQPVLELTDASGDVLAASMGATAAQTAGTTCVYSWSAGISSPSGILGSGANCIAQSGLPMGVECFLPVGCQIVSRTIGIGANSQWGPVWIYAAIV
jgi:hypothetical protein